MIQRPKSRQGFTLIELMLALGLTALVASLIGYLLQLYISITDSSDLRIKQAQVARSILTTIADDVRSVVRNQPFDGAALEEILSGSSSGAAGGQGGSAGGGASLGGSSAGGAGGGASSGTGSTPGPTPTPSGSGSPSGSPPTNGGSTGGGGGFSGGGSTGGGGSVSSSGTGGAGSTTPDPTSVTPPPAPGIYGTASALQVDVSRLPRPDQYFPQQADMLTGKMNDIPSDTKTVSYFVQAQSITGVQDPLFNPNAKNSGGHGGLVRRQLDRSISQWATNMGRTDQLNRTGEILSSEVLDVGYQYYDGTTWLSQWDSSVQGLPWVVEITIALQDPIVAKQNPIQPGVSVSTMDNATRTSYGIQTYSVTVAIPGAQLLSSPQPATSSGGSGSTDNGMGSLGM